MKIKLLINLFLILTINFTISNTLAKKADKEDSYDYNYAVLNNKCKVYDPYESFNRKMFVFNGVLDTFVLRPIAKGYGRFTNNYTKQRVNSFTSNIKEPLSFVNYMLQGDPKNSFTSFWRFTINSTFGVAGLFDVADKVGLQAEQQTFGNTLGHYGVGSGPYIILPLYSGMGMRDLLDPLVMNTALNPLKYALHSDFKNVLTPVNVIRSRDQIMPFTDYVTQNSPDPYIATRNAAISQREAKMAYPVNFKCPTVNKK